VALAVLFGVLVGVLLALVREATDSRIGSADQLRRLGATGVPVVEIPELTQAVSDGDVPPGIRVLRTVLFPTNRDRPATLVVCSCDERHPLPEVAPSLAHPTLWELPAGRVVPYPVVPYPENALASGAMPHAADSLRNSHDVVVIQAPPLDVGAEALAVAEATQAVVLLTVARGRTHRRQVRAALTLLASAGVRVAAIALVASVPADAASSGEE
jgi:hypothetical protein